MKIKIMDWKKKNKETQNDILPFYPSFSL